MCSLIAFEEDLSYSLRVLLSKQKNYYHSKITRGIRTLHLAQAWRSNIGGKLQQMQLGLAWLGLAWLGLVWLRRVLCSNVPIIF